MKTTILSSILALSLLASGCGNTIARRFGGTQTINLPANEKLVNVTWKEDSLWLLVRPMGAGEVAETLTFKESSPTGIMEGEVVIIESKVAEKN